MVIKNDKYSLHKTDGSEYSSAPFYSHQNGYKFKLRITYHTCYGQIGACLCMLTGENDTLLPWPVDVKVHLELLNQIGGHFHVERTKTQRFEKDRGQAASNMIIDGGLMTFHGLERSGDRVQYMMNDCLKFKIHLTVQAA